VTHVVVKEHIPMSQRVEAYVMEVQLADGSWKEVAKGTTIGRKRIARFDAVQTDTVRIRITDSRVCPVLSFVGVY
jgi:alpha-L-fucosidase